MFGNPLLLADDGYQISRSVRLRASASAYFNRTPSTASNRKTWTYSNWVKRGSITSGNPYMLGVNTAASQLQAAFYFTSTDTLIFLGGVSGSANDFAFETTQVFRDPSAWYHLVIQFDSTQATSTSRVRLYVNGSQITAFGTATYPTLNYDSAVNNTVAHWIGRGYTNYFDGYLTEINFIDGQALTPSSFGETDAITGVWKPKKYGGTYGTNGFFLNFSDNSSNTATTIGKDYSGNGNNWTPNNISVTAGSTYDSMLDVPTLWADGGNGRGNYCVWNALSRMGTPTNSAANLQTNLATGSLINGSMVVSSGKWYYETQFTSGADAFMGWNRVDLQTGTGNAFQQAGSLLYFSSNGNRYKDGDGGASYGASYTTSDAIGCAIDLDNNQVTWYKNNVAQSTISIIAGNYAPCLATGGTACNFLSNFGQRPFAYTPPTGFKALNTQNLPEPTIRRGNQYFNAVTYTGTGAARSVTGAGFQPDLVWIKNRSAAISHGLNDSVRGAGKFLYSNLTDAEGNFPTDFASFDADGFSLGSATGAVTNTNGSSYVAWQWKEGATQGFDIVTFAFPASGPWTLAHSLGVAPKMVIVKSRSNGAQPWVVYHAAVGNTGYLLLNTTDAFAANATVWNNTSPSSTVVTMGSGFTSTNYGANGVAYLFSEVAGFSRFGSYTGNGSADGPFVFCGFRPRWVMVKKTSATDDWVVFDTARDTFNVVNDWLFPNLSNAELTTAGSPDVLSNGFKLRSNSGATNASGASFIFAAFAESPFKTALAL